jgi:hypothetical protein
LKIELSQHIKTTEREKERGREIEENRIEDEAAKNG